MIAVIDYGMGNLQSVTKGLENAGADVELTASSASLKDADGIVLPGVGAFEAGMSNLKERGLIQIITERISDGIPFLGICLGMQLLFTESEEHGTHKGLDIIPGIVKRFDVDLKVPHMGWNTVHFKNQSPLFTGIGTDSYFYFVHSYYCIPENDKDTSGITEYGMPFTSAVIRDNINACQFHPEKSQKKGLKILDNFVNIVGTTKG